MSSIKTQPMLCWLGKQKLCGIPFCVCVFLCFYSLHTAWQLVLVCLPWLSSSAKENDKMNTTLLKKKISKLTGFDLFDLTLKSSAPTWPQSNCWVKQKKLNKYGLNTEENNDAWFRLASQKLVKMTSFLLFIHTFIILPCQDMK